MPLRVAVTSGKGGVGKSVIALNLAIALARAGRRVLAVDADLGLGNTAILLGLSPDWTLEDVLCGRVEAPAAVLPAPGEVDLLAAAADSAPDFWERTDVEADVVRGLQELEQGYDFVVTDTGAGVAAKTMDFVGAADEVVLLATPEPTAVADAYAALKALLQRGPGPRVGLVVNMAESAAEADEIHARFAELAGRFLGAQIDNTGYIPLDRYVREAVRRQTPFVLTSPPTAAAEAVGEIAGEFVRRAEHTMERPDGLFVRALELRYAAAVRASGPTE